jgi:transcriptional regulator with XRE-family HTH domain
MARDKSDKSAAPKAARKEKASLAKAAKAQAKAQKKADKTDTAAVAAGKAVIESLGSIGSLGDYLKEQRLDARLSLRQLADQVGVSNPYLSQIERGLRRPSAEVLQQLARALRVSAEQLYVRAGIVDPDTHAVSSVELSVLSDTSLTERQKQSLLDVYASFLALNAAVPPAGLEPADGSTEGEPPSPPTPHA